MDGSCIQKEKVADSKISGFVWTGPKLTVQTSVNDIILTPGTLKMIKLLLYKDKIISHNNAINQLWIS